MHRCTQWHLRVVPGEPALPAQVPTLPPAATSISKGDGDLGSSAPYLRTMAGVHPEVEAGLGGPGALLGEGSWANKSPVDSVKPPTSAGGLYNWKSHAQGGLTKSSLQAQPHQLGLLSMPPVSVPRPLSPSAPNFTAGILWPKSEPSPILPKKGKETPCVVLVTIATHLLLCLLSNCYVSDPGGGVKKTDKGPAILE